MINAIKFAIEEIEASDQYFDHTRKRKTFTPRSLPRLVITARKRSSLVVNGIECLKQHLAAIVAGDTTKGTPGKRQLGGSI